MVQKTDPVFTDFTCGVHQRALTPPHTHTHTNVNQSLPLTKLLCSLFLSSMILLYCCLPMIVWIIHHVCLFNDPHTKQTTVSYTSLPCPQQDTAAANEGLTRLTSPDLTNAQVGAAAIGCTDDGAEPMRCGGWKKSRDWMKVEDKWTSGETRWWRGMRSIHWRLLGYSVFHLEQIY